MATLSNELTICIDSCDHMDAKGGGKLVQLYPFSLVTHHAESDTAARVLLAHTSCPSHHHPHLLITGIYFSFLTHTGQAEVVHASRGEAKAQPWTREQCLSCSWSLKVWAQGKINVMTAILCWNIELLNPGLWGSNFNSERNMQLFLSHTSFFSLTSREPNFPVALLSECFVHWVNSSRLLLHY